MLTVIETPIFSSDAEEKWHEDERQEFAVWIAANPLAGDVIPGSGGCRKVRWGRSGIGKRGGARIIYFARLNNGEVWLLLMYAKSVRENIPAHWLKKVREALDNA